MATLCRCIIYIDSPEPLLFVYFIWAFFPWYNSYIDQQYGLQVVKFLKVSSEKHHQLRVSSFPELHLKKSLVYIDISDMRVAFNSCLQLHQVVINDHLFGY